MTVALYVTLYLVPALVAAGLTAYGWQRRYARGGRPFSLLMGALTLWLVCHSLSIAAPDLASTLFWLKLQYVGIVFIGPAWLLMALAYSGQWWRTKLRVRFALFIPPVIFASVALTNDVHHLWRKNIVPVVDSSLPLLKFTSEHGPFFWIHTGYSYLCIGIGVATFVYTVLTSPPVYRYQTWLILFGSFIPVIGNIAFITGFQPFRITDLTPFLMLASGLLFSYATLRYQLLDLAPIAEREVFASLPDGVIVCDNDGIVVSANDLAPTLLQLSFNQTRWVGKSLLDVVAASPLVADIRKISHTPNQAQSLRTTYTHNGKLWGTELRIRPLHTTSGARAGTLLVLRDTTERVQMEQAHAQNLAELELINRIASIANTATATDELIHAISHEIAQQLHWDRVMIGTTSGANTRVHLVTDHGSDELSPSYAGEYIDIAEFPEVIDVLQSRQTKLFATQDPAFAQTLTGRMLRRNGLQTLLVVPMHHHDAPLGVLLMASAELFATTPRLVRLTETIGDLITDAVMRTQLYDEVQHANQLKSVFLATVSHELRTPLTSVIGYVDMINRGIYGEIPETAREPMTYVRHSSRTLLRLITDILDYSKLEAGHLRVELQPIDVMRSIYTLVGTLRPQVEEQGLAFCLDLPAHMPAVQGNSMRFEQVLTNLVSNAIKFTDTGSVTIRVVYSETRMHVSVIDTGPGIAPEDQQVIFDEFRQLDQGTTRRAGGTGLGLAISKRLVEHMGGTLRLESTLGAGSTFHFDLQIAELPTDELETVMGTTNARSSSTNPASPAAYR